MTVTVIMHHDRISWIIGDGAGEEQPAIGSEPLVHAGGDYMVLLSNVVNRINNDYEVEHWNFLRS
jgi:hypothetical protein